MSERPQTRSGVSRRESLALAAAAVVAGEAVLPSAATAQSGTRTSRRGRGWIVVDPSGTGDVRTLEEGVRRIADGGTLLAVAGTHEVPRTVTLREGMRIVGEGEGTTLQGSAEPLVRIAGPHVALQAVRLQADGERRLVEVAAPYARLADCRFDGGHPESVLLTGRADHAIVHACRFADAGDGLRFVRASHGTVSANVFDGCDGAGIELERSRSTAIAGNVVRDGGAGIRLAGATDSSVTGNAVSGARVGIQLGPDPDGGPASHCTVVGNVCAGAAADGIRAEGVRSCVLADNTLRANDGDGIAVSGAAGCAVTGNVAHDNGRAGIAIRDSEDCVCNGNAALQNGRDEDAGDRRAGIVLDGERSGVSSIAVVGNRCTGGTSALTQRHGISVLGTSADLLLGANVLSDHEGSGLVLRSPERPDAIPWRRIEATVGSERTTVAHGLGYAPLVMTISMLGEGAVWRDAPPDESGVHLRADADGRRAVILVG